MRNLKEYSRRFDLNCNESLQDTTNTQKPQNNFKFTQKFSILSFLRSVKTKKRATFSEMNTGEGRQNSFHDPKNIPSRGNK